MPMGNVNVSETAMIDFENRVHHNFVNGNFQLKPVLGSKWKRNITNASKVRFNIGTEILAKKKVGVGSLVTQSKGGKIKPKYAFPEEYEVTSIVGQIEYDETGVFLSQEFVRMHSNALNLKTDEIVLEVLTEATYRDKNVFGGGTLFPDKINLQTYEDSAAGKKDGLVNVIQGTAGIGGSRTKYMIIDTAAHAQLLKNEKFINSDYGTAGPVVTGSLAGLTRLGLKILLLEDLDEEFHGVNSLYEMVGATKQIVIVTEETIGAACHFMANKSSITKEPILKNDWLIYTEMSLGCVILSNRALFKINYA